VHTAILKVMLCKSCSLWMKHGERRVRQRRPLESRSCVTVTGCPPPSPTNPNHDYKPTFCYIYSDSTIFHEKKENELSHVTRPPPIRNSELRSFPENSSRIHGAHWRCAQRWPEDDVLLSCRIVGASGEIPPETISVRGIMPCHAMPGHTVCSVGLWLTSRCSSTNCSCSTILAAT
jgi:hypothetical protein